MATISTDTYHKTTQTESYYKTIEGLVPDVDAPVYVSSVIPDDGLTLTLTYSDASSLNTSITPATTDYSLSGTSSTVSAVQVLTSTVVLSLSPTAYLGETITVSYTPGTNKLQDVAGNLAASLSNQSVTNNSTQSATNQYYEAYYDARTNKPTGAVATSLNLLCEKLSGDNNLSFDFLNNSDRFGLIGIDTMSDGDWAIDLKDPTKSITDVNNTYKNIYSGVKGDAVSKYINTNYNPSTDGSKYTLNDASFWVYSLDEVEEDAKMHGARTPRVHLGLFSSSHIIGLNSDGYDLTTGGGFKGLKAITRDNSSTINLYYKDQGGEQTEASTAPANYDLYLLALDNKGPAAFTSDERIGAWGAGGSMTEAQCQELETILDWWFNFGWLSLGSELVTNGDFSQGYTNGVPNGWTGISTDANNYFQDNGGSCEVVTNGSSPNLRLRAGYVESGKKYLLSVKLSGVQGDSVLINIGGGIALTSDGTLRIIADSTGVAMQFYGLQNQNGLLIDNVSVKEIIGL